MVEELVLVQIVLKCTARYHLALSQERYPKTVAGVLLARGVNVQLHVVEAFVYGVEYATTPFHKTVVWIVVGVVLNMNLVIHTNVRKYKKWALGHHG